MTDKRSLKHLMHAIEVEIQAACHRAGITPLQAPHFEAALENIRLASHSSAIDQLDLCPRHRHLAKPCVVCDMESVGCKVTSISPSPIKPGAAHD